MAFHIPDSLEVDAAIAGDEWMDDMNDAQPPMEHEPFGEEEGAGAAALEEKQEIAPDDEEKREEVSAREDKHDGAPVQHSPVGGVATPLEEEVHGLEDMLVCLEL